MSESMQDFEKELEESYKEMEAKQQKYEAVNEEEQAQWEELQEMKDDNREIDVKIKEIVKGGAVAYVGEMRGFIPASKLSLGYVENLEEFTGQHIKVRVFEVDPQTKKLILSAKEILREQEDVKKEQAMKDMQVGTILEGVVENIQPYGAFVRLDNGLSGLVHISQIANRRIKTPAEVLSMGERISAKLTQIKDGKLSLSIKALNDNLEPEESYEKVDIPDSEELTTSLGSLFANIKLDD